MSTQVEIARQLGLDVSSVNKILNKSPRATFREETIKLVFAKAKEIGYKPSSASKGSMRRTLETMFPGNINNTVLAGMRGIDPSEVARIKRMLYGVPDFKL